MKMCPRCEQMPLDEDNALNSLSRRDNETHICDLCGDEEGLIDAGMMEINERERRFVEDHKK